MLRRLFVVAALAMLLFPVASRAQELNQGEWLLSINGSAFHGPDLDGVSGGIGGDLSYMLTDQLELGVRQTINYSDLGPGSAWNGSTRVHGDFNFDLGQWYPFVGANFGYVYGDNTNDTWAAGLEGGVKVFVNSNTYIFGIVEYQFFFDNDNDSTSESFSDGQFVYSLGIGFTF